MPGAPEGEKDGALLGKGSQKRVTSVTRNGRRLALMTSRRSSSSSSRALLREALMMRYLDHKNLLPLEKVGFDASSRVMMEVPIARFGSVPDLVDDLEFEGELAELTAEHVEEALAQVAAGLRFMHSVGLRHNDLAARNVLVFRFERGRPAKTHVKLGDFGEASVGGGAESLAALHREMHSLRE